MLIRKLFGKEDAEKVYNEYYSNRKWIYLKGPVPLVEDFDGSGAKNKKIRNLMPQVIAYFNKESENCQSH